MHADYRGRGSSHFDALKTILISLVVVFLIQLIAERWVGSDAIQDYLGLSLPNLKSGLVYTVLSYGYLHSTAVGVPWHLILNALLLYFTGQMLRERMGSARLYEFFHLSVLAGGIAWVPVALLHQEPTQLIGASAGVFGFLAMFALFSWDETIRLMLFFILPVELRGRTIFYLILGAQGFFFLFSELPGQITDSTAYSAHLGGIGFAYLYDRFLLSRPTLWSFLSGSNRKMSATRTSPGRRSAAPTGRFRLNLGGKASAPRGANSGKTEPLRAEVDRILDKINAKGFGSLTTEEKQTLDRAKDGLN